MVTNIKFLAFQTRFCIPNTVFSPWNILNTPHIPSPPLDLIWFLCIKRKLALETQHNLFLLFFLNRNVNLISIKEKGTSLEYLQFYNYKYFWDTFFYVEFYLIFLFLRLNIVFLNLKELSSSNWSFDYYWWEGVKQPSFYDKNIN